MTFDNEIDQKIDITANNIRERIRQLAPFADSTYLDYFSRNEIQRLSQQLTTWTAQLEMLWVMKTR